MVQKSRGKAEEALKEVPEIEALIKEAEDRTQEARDALSGAENDANEALSIAEEAERVAQGASDVSGHVLNSHKNYIIHYPLIHLFSNLGCFLLVLTMAYWKIKLMAFYLVIHGIGI